MEEYVTIDCETTGLHPWHGDIITTICAKTNTGQEFKMVKEQQQPENAMLISFIEWIRKHETKTLVTKNGVAFDIPFILTRCAQNKMVLPNFLTEMRHYDIQLAIKKWVSLKDYAHILGCANHKSGSGVDAPRLYRDKQYNYLLIYCWKDVLTTEEVYKKLKKNGVDAYHEK